MLRAYRGARRRLLVLGYNATLTTAVEAPRQPKRHFDQIKARAPRSCVQAHSCLGRRMCSSPLYWVSLVHTVNCRYGAGACCQVSCSAELLRAKAASHQQCSCDCAGVRVHAGRAQAMWGLGVCRR